MNGVVYFSLPSLVCPTPHEVPRCVFEITPSSVVYGFEYREWALGDGIQEREFLEEETKKMGIIKSSSRLRRLMGKIAQLENLKSNLEIGPKLVQVFKNVDSTNLGFKLALL